MKWYTYSQYVDQQTGEMLTSNEAKRNYLIIKKIKTNEYREQWGNPTRNGTRTLEKYGVRTITNLCTKEGKQRELWGGD